MAWFLAATPIAQQPPPQGAATEADVELWSATIRQLQSEQRPRQLALMNETLPAGEFQDRLAHVTSEPILIDRLLQRNEAPTLIGPSLKLPIELVDAASVRRSATAELDIDVIGARFGQKGRRPVRLSLPVFSDDRARALVFTWTAGGFDDLRGGGYVFERKRGEWIVVGYLAAWIT